MKKLLILLLIATFVGCTSSSPTGTKTEEPEGNGPDGNGSDNDDPVTYALTTQVDPAEGGSVTPDGGEYEEGEEVELTATANDNWVFAGWDGDLSGSDNPAVVTMNADKAVTAMFVPVEHALTLQTEGEGTVTERIIEQAKMKDYQHGVKVELTAAPSEGWKFTQWQGDLSGSENPASITIDAAKTVTAVFEQKEYLKIGEPYQAADGLTVTLNSFETAEKTGSFQYQISYTLQNNTDGAIDEGQFQLYYEGREGAEKQYGFFGELFPGDSLDRSYTFEAEKDVSFSVLAYHHDQFFAVSPPADGLLWKVE